jgi:hypothetical protein
LAIQPALAPSVPAFVVARPGAELGPLSPGSRGRTSDEGMNAIVANRGGDRSSSERAGLRSIGAAGPSPEAMQRVFLRAGPAGGSAGVLATRLEREAVLVEQGLQVVRRIVDDRRRVEEQRWTPHVARRVGTAIPTMDAEREAGGVMTHARRTHLRPSGDDSQAPPRSVPSAPVAPAMDVQQLTDQVMQQIDRRLVAYRERLGKAF